jgi:uncharacterized protein involved in type VI secretion and phage assembly
MALPAPSDGSAPSYFGVYPAIVTNLVDPDRLGRIQVRFPWLGTDGDRDVRAWATLCTPYADNNQGLQILPEVDSQVVVAFEAGNPRRPYIVGSAWNGTARLPERPRRANDLRLLRSRSGSRLEFDDNAGGAKVTLTTSGGHQVVLDAGGAGQVTVKHASGTTVRLNPASVEVTCTGTVDVTAAKVNVKAAVSTFSGVVECTTLLARALVKSPAYTPGVGNLW